MTSEPNEGAPANRHPPLVSAEPPEGLIIGSASNAQRRVPVAELDRYKKNRLSPKEVALLKVDPVDLNWFLDLALGFLARFLAAMQNECR